MTELVENVFSVISKIYTIVKQVKENRKECKEAAERCEELEGIIRFSLSLYKENDSRGFNKFDRLLKQLKTLLKLVETYSKRGFVMRGVKAKSFKKEMDGIFEKIFEVVSHFLGEFGFF